MLSEFLFELLTGVGPVDGFGGLVVIGDVVGESGFERGRRAEVVGLQAFALQQTEPDFDLIQPGGVGWQPEELKVQLPVTRLFLLPQPVFQLFGRMGGAIIQDHDHGLHLPTQRFGNDLLLHKSLEIDKAFALATGAVDLPIGDGEPGKQMAGAAPLIARFVQHRLAWTRWTRRPFALTGLDGGFLIEADQPGTCLQKRTRLGIGVQHRACPLQERDRIMDMLPGVITPGTQAFGFEPATHRTGRDGRQTRMLDDASGQLGATPARERDLALLGQTTGDGGDLRAHLGGENASAPHCAAHRQANGS